MPFGTGEHQVDELERVAVDLGRGPPVGVVQPQDDTPRGCLEWRSPLARLEQADRLPELEEAFVKVAASWCKHNEITAAASCEVGVPARVLAKAGQ